jgi:hypothetical protein
MLTSRHSVVATKALETPWQLRSRERDKTPLQAPVFGVKGSFTLSSRSESRIRGEYVLFLRASRLASGVASRPGDTIRPGRVTAIHVYEVRPPHLNDGAGIRFAEGMWMEEDKRGRPPQAVRIRMQTLAQEIRWALPRARLALVAGVLVFMVFASAGSSLRAEIVLSGDGWERYVKLGAEAGRLPPAIVTTANGQKSLHMQRPSADKFALYLLKVTSLPAGRTRFPVRLVARQVQDTVNGLAVRNLSLDPDDPASDDSIQVQASFVAVLLSDRTTTGPRARDDRDLSTDVDAPNTLGGLSGTRVEDPTLSTVTNPSGQLTTVNATLQLAAGLNVLRLDPTDLRELPSYDPDTGYQLFSITIGPGEPGLEGEFLGGITVRQEDWDNFAALGAEPGFIPPLIATTADGFKSLHMHRPSVDKFGLYLLNVTALPPDTTRFPVKVVSRQVRDDTNALGIRNLTIDPDDPNSDRTQQVQRSFCAVLVSDGASGDCPEAEDDLGNQDHESTQPLCAGGIGLSGRLVQDAAAALLASPAGEITTAEATLELRLGFNVIRLDPTDPRDLPAYDPNTGYQVFLLNIGPEETGLKGEAVLPCAVSRDFTPNPYFPGELVTVTLSAQNLLEPITVTDTFPSGWTVVNAGGGSVAGNTITFAISSAGTVTYTLRASEACESVRFVGETSGLYCRGTVLNDSRRLRCGIQFSGGVTGMLFAGPIDLGDAGPECDHQGRLGTTDYLRRGVGGESSVLVRLGDILQPDFGGASGGLGVKPAPNAALNPRRSEGILTVWRADADANGRINLQDADNIGALDHHLVYGIVYIDNPTGGCLDAVLEVLSDDAVKVLVNGEILHASAGCRTLGTPGSGDMVPVRLASGRNVVVFAVVQGTGTNGIQLLVRHPDGTPMRDGPATLAYMPPAAYPAAPAGTVTRAFAPPYARPGDALRVELAFRDLGGQTAVADTFPAGWTVAQAGGGTLNGNTISFTRSTDGDASYMLQVPLSFTGPAAFSGTVRGAGAGACGGIGGASTAVIVASDLACTPDPGAPPVELVRAFAFGSRLLDCPSFNDLSVPYTVVHHAGNDAAAAALLAFAPARGWGYEVVYPDAANMPFGARSGFGIFGPFDDSVNNRDEFPSVCPEEIYDSHIGMKTFLQVCDQAAVGNTVDPCTTATTLPGGIRYVPAGGVFRVNVPNGRYRFVAAVGDADNPHTHRILAEDGGSGPPDRIGPNHVVLVKSFDQSQYGIGETDTVEPGKGVYARVGFDCRIPPPGDGVLPSPKFVNMDASGQATAGPPSSPELRVTQGHIRIHQLQGNSNAGPGSADPDPNGADLVVLELWRLRTDPCPPQGDTHCTGLAVSGPEGNSPGAYVATATASDDVRDVETEALYYTFRAQRGGEPPLVAGPQLDASATFDLNAGTWTVSVEVDDDLLCPDRAADAVCSQAVTVVQPAGGQIPGDSNQDGDLDISDAIFLLRFLFAGTVAALPCGDGTIEDPANVLLADFNGDGRIDLSDAVSTLRHLFLGAGPHSLGRNCTVIAGCESRCVP